MQPGKFRVRPGWPCALPAVLPHVDGQVADYRELALVRRGTVLVAVTALAAMLKCVTFLYGRLDGLTSRTRTERTGAEGRSVRRAER